MVVVCTAKERNEEKMSQDYKIVKVVSDGWRQLLGQCGAEEDKLWRGMAVSRLEGYMIDKIRPQK